MNHPNKLNNLQIIDKDDFSPVFLATWLDSIRIISGKSGKYKQSRKPLHIVDLKTLHRVQDLLDFLKVG